LSYAPTAVSEVGPNFNYSIRSAAARQPALPIAPGTLPVGAG